MRVVKDLVSRGIVMVEYRRGLESKTDKHLWRYVWQSHWHFDERCPNYPRQSFEIRKERPPTDELCPECGWKGS